jgi:hypothetical protein
MAATSHPLNSNWTLWAGDANEPDWGKKLQPLCHISTVEEFWQNYNHIPKPSVCFFDGDFKTKVGPSNKVRLRRERRRAELRDSWRGFALTHPWRCLSTLPVQSHLDCPNATVAMLPHCWGPWGRASRLPAQRPETAITPRDARPGRARRGRGLADLPACETRVVTGGSATRSRQVVLPLCFPSSC